MRYELNTVKVKGQDIQVAILFGIGARNGGIDSKSSQLSAIRVGPRVV